ncbi:hypothetical protein MKW98_003765 [Papaver atlanticum]|uniref:NOT2/NOT3/NOT5 C-terminal domain-containing protein n=1 Tax=Papaver atlanticum TaxID=357466 RepID=A0AAD4T8B3_9MAGN|nr:hypothetical protein MKW98_003765 [Papaver atlanticum]
MSGILNSSLSGSNSNLPESTSRPFATSFAGQSAAPSPVYNHSGNMQGMQNMNGNFSVQNMSGTLTARSAAGNGAPSSSMQQPIGSLSSGRYPSNNIPVGLSQISHGGSQGHLGIPNRGGLVSPILGNAGARMTSSMGNISIGGNNGRNISSGGMSVSGLASRLNMTANTGSGNLAAQGPNRYMGGMLQQATPQVMSMLGNSYPSAGGQLSQNQIQGGNNFRSMGMLSDMNSNENSPFDMMNDFPQLNGRPSSAGGPQGQGSMRKLGAAVSSVVQQNQEFSIQNEDFPALPGFKGGNADYGMDLHQKEQFHDSSGSMMQSQHFPMGRSGGFSFSESYPSSRTQQHQQQHASSVSSGGLSYTPSNNQDLQLHGSDLFPSSHSPYHSQVQSSGQPSMGLRNSSNSVSGVGSYDQLLQNFQQQQNQSQFRLSQMPSASRLYRDRNMKSTHVSQASPDQYGLLGLLSVIRISDKPVSSLYLGIDLTSLGLNLNAVENLHKTFGSPWSDEPAKGDPEYTVPECYYAKQPPVLQQSYFKKFQLETLFYIFYSMPRDEAQLYAANELYNRGWFFHRDLRVWFFRMPNLEPLAKTETYERGSYHCFDSTTWETVRKDNFVLQYKSIESRPVIPQH